MVRNSIHEEETRGLTSHGAQVDPDITDFWDDTGVPPPHRLSTLYSPSPYPNAHESSPLAPPRPSSSSAYLDPFYHPSDSIELEPHPLNNNIAKHDHDSMSGYNQGPHAGPSHNYAAGGADLTSSGSFDSLHKQGNDAWGIPASGSQDSMAQARERYLARKEATLAAQGDDYGYPTPKKRTNKKKWAILGVIAVVIIAIVTTVTVVLVKRHSNSKHSSSNNPPKTSGVVNSNPADPSKFVKNPRLHKSLWGICYTPLNAQYPQCGDTQANVTEDIQIISQLTSRVRLYGADCNTSQLVLEAIRQTKVDMKVYLAVWVDDNAVTFQRQVDEVVAAIQAYGTDHVAGVTVGNEFLLNGGSESDLIHKIQQVRTKLNSLHPNKKILVGTADAGSMITTELATGSDYVMANVHAWFGGVPVEQAAGWTWHYTNHQEPASALLAPNRPPLYIAEAGWPTGANETRLETYQASVAGIDQLNTFLDTFICQSNANVTKGTGQPAFYFEAFDEPWKDVLYGGVEAHWGLFTSDKKLKDGVVIPDCPAA